MSNDKTITETLPVSEAKKFGVIEAPSDLILRNGETIEWGITYRDENSLHKENSFIIHSNTWQRAESGFKELFPGKRVLLIKYLGTYQY